MWWGQRIPAWYDRDGNYVVAATKENALIEYKNKFGKNPALVSNDNEWLHQVY